MAPLAISGAMDTRRPRQTLPRVGVSTQPLGRFGRKAASTGAARRIPRQGTVDLGGGREAELRAVEHQGRRGGRPTGRMGDGLDGDLARQGARVEQRQD